MSSESKDKRLNKFWEKLGIPVCSLKEARRVIEHCFLNKQVACMIGEAGIGKTHLMRQIAEDNDWDAVFLYLAHLEREDIGGIPYPSGNGNMSYEFLCEKSIKTIIDNDRPTLIALDEWNRGEKPVMNAAFTLMEERRFGSYKLPDHVYIVTAMNPSEANYMVNEAEKDPAFRRRLVMMAVQSNITAFLDHARGRGNFHSLVIEYLESQPQALNDSAARDAGKVYANPAAWEKISDGLKSMDAQKMDLLENERLLNIWGAGVIGMGVMSQFTDFVKESATAISALDVVTNYKKKVQTKVKRLVDTGRSDALMEVCEGVATTLVGRRTEFKDKLSKIAKHLGEFLNDLPPEATMAFLNKLGKHVGDAGEEGTQFHLDISEALSHVPAYNNAVEKIGDAHDKVENDAEKSKEEEK